jgi:hypothetical protein
MSGSTSDKPLRAASDYNLILLTLDCSARRETEKRVYERINMESGGENSTKRLDVIGGLGLIYFRAS